MLSDHINATRCRALRETVVGSRRTCGAEMQHVFGALRHDQTQTDRFFGTFAGTVPIQEFFAPENMARLLIAAPV